MEWGPPPAAVRHKWLYWVLLVVAVLAVLLFAMAALGTLLEAAGYSSTKGHVDVAGDVVGAVICLAIAAGFVVWAIHLEHRLRGHRVAARAGRSEMPWGAPEPFSSSPLGGPAPPPPWVASRPPGRSRARRRRGRCGPVVAIFHTCLFVGLFVGCIVGTVRMYGEAARSSDVQHHGIRALGTVEEVRNTSHSSRSGTYYTADITVNLSPPVQGRTTTLVRYPGRFRAPAGYPLAVVVDRHDPGYAEFPGSPDTTNSSWILTAVFSAVLLLPLALLARTAVRLLRRRLHWWDPMPHFGGPSPA